MPTICELKEQLKELGVKGYSGKNKAELVEMLGQATAPVKIKRKKPAVASTAKPIPAQPTVFAIPAQKEEKLPQSTPPPIIPNIIKKSMINKLRQDYDTHEYKVGLAHPVEDMIKWFRKVQGQETFWGKNYDTAYDFLRQLIGWVTKNSHDGALLVSDWEKLPFA
jgi:hypothetical protein